MQRTLTVSYLPGHTDDVPYLRLQGHWLRMVGFPVGCRVTVIVNHRELIITPKDDNHDQYPSIQMHTQTTENANSGRTSPGAGHTDWQAAGTRSQLPEHRAEKTEPQKPNEKDQ